MKRMTDRPSGPPAPGGSFLWRRLKVALHPRPGAAPSMPWDPAAFARGDHAVTWIGHASFLVRMDGATFATDPIFSRRCSPVQFFGPPRLVPPGVPLDGLPKLDFATLSHDHYDHTDKASIAALGARGVPFFVPTGMGPLVRSFGAQATELGWWQSAPIGDLRVHCVPAQHFSGRTLWDRNRRLWAGWIVEGPTRRFYHAGDTAYFPGFTAIREGFGPIDLAAMPIGAYLPREMMRPVHVDPAEAVRAAVDLGTRRVLAMHFGTFDLADEPLDEPPRLFREHAAAAGLGEDRAWVMKIGETREW
jgi:L-ascorbate metabolism protein UlaG (beta-lactamase superfamily)